jgi:glutamine synthetase type III
MEKVEINENMYRLYTICLKYLSMLEEKAHPKINSIKNILDLLIKLKEDENKLNEQQKEKVFNEIHSKAYKNIEDIFEYDKEQEENAKKALEEQVAEEKELEQKTKELDI